MSRKDSGHKSSKSKTAAASNPASSTSAASCPAFLPPASVLCGPTPTSLSWRIIHQVGEGTFSRIYSVVPLPVFGCIETVPTDCCVVKVNKLSPMMSRENPLQSFELEEKVWRDIQQRQKENKHVSIPLLYSRNASCIPDLSGCTSTNAATGSVPAVQVTAAPAVEYLVLQQCGVDLSALRTFWQSRSTVKNHGEPLAGIEIGMMALEALQSFHACGYVHRDIKPSNFLALPHPALNSSSSSTPSSPSADVFSRVLITDFGLSRTQKQLDDKAEGDIEHKAIGKSLYASFASHNARPQCPRDDVISLFFVILDLMYGNLPWKKLSTAKLNADGTTKSPQQRWEEVVKVKDRLFGNFVCERADEEAENDPSSMNDTVPFLYDDADKSNVPNAPRPIQLPVRFQLIFHELHSRSTINYDDILRRMKQIARDLEDEDPSRKGYKAILQEYHDSIEAEVLQERKRRKEEEEKIQKEERKRKEEIQREIDKKRIAAEATAAFLKAKALKQAAGQLSTTAAANTITKTPSTTNSNLLKPTSQISSSSSSSSSSSTGASLSSASPPAYPSLSLPARVLLGRLTKLDWQLNRGLIDLTESDTGKLVYRQPSASSLESLWSSIDWNTVSQAAVKRTSLSQVRFDEWSSGNWAHIFQGIQSLIPTQMESLVSYLQSSSSVFVNNLHQYFPLYANHIARTPSSSSTPAKPIEDRLLKLNIAVHIASLFCCMKKAEKGEIAIVGFKGHTASSIQAMEAKAAKAKAAPPPPPPAVAPTPSTVTVPVTTAASAIPPVSSPTPAAAVPTTPTLTATTTTPVIRKSIPKIGGGGATPSTPAMKPVSTPTLKPVAKKISQFSSSEDDTSSSSSSEDDSETSSSSGSESDDEPKRKASAKQKAKKETSASTSKSKSKSKSTASAKSPSPAPSEMPAPAAPAPMKVIHYSDDEPSSDEGEEEEAIDEEKEEAKKFEQEEQELEKLRAVNRDIMGNAEKRQHDKKIENILADRKRREDESRRAKEAKLKGLSRAATAEQRKQDALEKLKSEHLRFETDICKRFRGASAQFSFETYGKTTAAQVSAASRKLGHADFDLPVAFHLSGEALLRHYAEEERKRVVVYDNINSSGDEDEDADEEMGEQESESEEESKAPSKKGGKSTTSSKKTPAKSSTTASRRASSSHPSVEEEKEDTDSATSAAAALQTPKMRRGKSATKDLADFAEPPADLKLQVTIETKKSESNDSNGKTAGKKRGNSSVAESIDAPNKKVKNEGANDDDASKEAPSIETPVQRKRGRQTSADANTANAKKGKKP